MFLWAQVSDLSRQWAPTKIMTQGSLDLDDFLKEAIRSLPHTLGDYDPCQLCIVYQGQRLSPDDPISIVQTSSARNPLLIQILDQDGVGWHDQEPVAPPAVPEVPAPSHPVFVEEPVQPLKKIKVEELSSSLVREIHTSPQVIDVDIHPCSYLDILRYQKRSPERSLQGSFLCVDRHYVPLMDLSGRLIQDFDRELREIQGIIVTRHLRDLNIQYHDISTLCFPSVEYLYMTARQLFLIKDGGIYIWDWNEQVLYKFGKTLQPKTIYEPHLDGQKELYMIIRL